MRSSRAKLFLAASAGLLACLVGRSVATTDEAPRSVKDLQKERVEVLTERVALARKLAAKAAAVKDEVKFWEERLAVASAELEGRTADLRRIYEGRLAALREAEKTAEKLYKIQSGSYAEVLEVREARLEVEIALARLK
jgi:hypothetical protein